MCSVGRPLCLFPRHDDTRVVTQVGTYIADTPDSDAIGIMKNEDRFDEWKHLTIEGLQKWFKEFDGGDFAKYAKAFEDLSGKSFWMLSEAHLREEFGFAGAVLHKYWHPSTYLCWFLCPGFHVCLGCRLHPLACTPMRRVARAFVFLPRRLRTTSHTLYGRRPCCACSPVVCGC